MDFQAAVDEIENPIICDSGASVDPGLAAPVVVQRSVGNLDEKNDIRSRWMMLGIIIDAARNNQHIRLGLAPVRKSERRLNADRISLQEDASQDLRRLDDRCNMWSPDRTHALDDLPFYELYSFLRPEDAGIGKLIVFITRPASHKAIRRVGVWLNVSLLLGNRTHSH